MIPIDWPLSDMALFLASTYLLLSSQASTPLFHHIHISHIHIVSSQITLVIYIIQFFFQHFYFNMADITCKEIGTRCPADGSPLGYAPNMAASIIFTGIFSLSLFGHTFLGCKYKTWSFMIAMLLGCSCEVVGYL